MASPQISKKDFFEFKKYYFIKVKNLTCLGSSFFKIFIKPYTKYEEIKFIKISHKGVIRTEKGVSKKKLTNQRIKLLNRINQQLITESALYIFDCEIINVEEVIFGHMKLYSDFIVFESSEHTFDYQAKSEFIFSSSVSLL